MDDKNELLDHVIGRRNKCEEWGAYDAFALQEDGVIMPSVKRFGSLAEH